MTLMYIHTHTFFELLSTLGGFHCRFIEQTFTKNDDMVNPSPGKQVAMKIP